MFVTNFLLKGTVYPQKFIFNLKVIKLHYVYLVNVFNKVIQKADFFNPYHNFTPSSAITMIIYID